MAVSGGFRTTVGGLRLSVRSPLPIAISAIGAAAVWLWIARRQRSVAADLESAWRAIERFANPIIVSIAVTVAVVSGVFATRSAAGADASGYISEGAALARGQLFYQDDLFDLTRGHDAFLTSPLGWRPTPNSAAQAPTYPPGLPLLMAVPHAIAGVDGAAAVVGLSAAVAVAATGSLALVLGGAAAGVIAATLIGFSPVFMHQAIQPMSDVPVTAAWMLSFLFIAKGRSRAAGVACAIAVLIRPNLAPLALVPLVLAGDRMRFGVPVALSGILLGVLQTVWYGSPLRSGYGSADALFAIANIGGNVERYSRWLLATSPVLVLAVFGGARLRAERNVRGLAAFAMLVIAAYLVYAVFDDWSYLRFLLPALAVFAVLTAIEFAAWFARCPQARRAPLLLAVGVAIAAHGLSTMRSLDTFKLAGQLQRVSQAADFVNAHTPRGAVIVAGEQSGSMRYYTGRSILRWEAATSDALSASIGTLEQSARPVYIVLDVWEEGLFRSKFAGVPAASLDWPPMLETGTTHRTRMWKLSDRQEFLRGERIETVRVP